MILLTFYHINSPVLFCKCCSWSGLFQYEQIFSGRVVRWSGSTFGVSQLPNCFREADTSDLLHKLAVSNWHSLWLVPIWTSTLSTHWSWEFNFITLSDFLKGYFILLNLYFRISSRAWAKIVSKSFLILWLVNDQLVFTSLVESLNSKRFMRGQRSVWLNFNSRVVSWTWSGVFHFTYWTARMACLFGHCTTLSVKTWRVLDMLAWSHMLLFYSERINTFLRANARNTRMLLNNSVLREQHMKFLALLGGTIFVKPVLRLKVKHLVVFICWRKTFATLTPFPSFLWIFQKMSRTLCSKHTGWMHNKATRGVSELSNHWFFTDAIRHFVVTWTRSDEIHRNSQRLFVIKSRVDWFIWFQKFSPKTASRITKSTINWLFSLLLWGSVNFFVLVFNRHLSFRSCSSYFSYVRISKFFDRSFICRCFPIFRKRS